MSHELRTPLTAIISSSGLLADTTLTPQQQELLSTIQLSSRHQLNLVNDILDLFKIGAGNFEVNSQNFLLDELIDDVEHLFSARSNERVSFSVEREAQFTHLLVGDKQRLMQILVNLLSNAFKFTAQGVVELKVWRDGERLFMSVSDQGIGISSETLGRLFKPFEQADQSISRRFGGTGLGLHISKRLLEEMQGTITVESQEGMGSTFTISLPLQISDQAVPAKAEKREEERPCFQGRVLIAEDNDILQVTQRRLLERVGIEVTLAVNGREAIDKALSGSYDLVLMDMQMPEVDGIDATRQLRAEGYEVPIVAVTGNVLDAHRQMMEESGCNGILVKPFEQHELYAVLGRHLQKVDVPALKTDGGGSALDKLLKITGDLG